MQGHLCRRRLWGAGPGLPGHRGLFHRAGGAHTGLCPAGQVYHPYCGAHLARGAGGEAKLLRGCYDTSLCLAWDQGCRSIAFPLISAGIYGYPKQEALEIALDAMTHFAQDHPMDITLAVLDPGIADLAEAIQRKGRGDTLCP